jgi:hypothetical protein
MGTIDLDLLRGICRLAEQRETMLVVDSDISDSNLGLF